MIRRCRFAPSPSGRLHVGGARSALYNLLFARGLGGRFVLRIEDTDRVRSSLESEQGICADLRWLGLQWDEGPDVGGPGAPYRQSERREIYDAALRTLIDAGYAYEAWESRDELDALRKAAEAAKENFRYRRVEHDPAQVEAWRAEGRVPVYRFATHGQGARFVDQILGEVDVKPEDIEDFVIYKTDGFPTYHFAVVIDDHHMGVTDVMRAQEHLLNTAKHILLYRAFGWEPPTHAHMPLIFSMSGGKMSKRDKAKVARAVAQEQGAAAVALATASGLPVEAVTAFLAKETDDVAIAEALAGPLAVELPEIEVTDFRRAGFLPEALVNFLALLGWSAGDDREFYTLDELAEAFSVERVGKTAARFDRDKLLSMNASYMRSSSVERLEAGLADYLEDRGGPLAEADPGLRRQLILAYKERARTFRELEQSAAWVFAAPTEYGPEKSVAKALIKGQVNGLAALASLRPHLASLEDWSAEGVEGLIAARAEAEFEGKMGKLAQPLRFAMTGGPVSPGIGETVALLSQEEALRRVDALLAHYA
ncbi:MAG: glutamate--tRNA ligase [Alphaproteobacteria bacterium]|nr:glutamate--tRNA ligase [Alphaproteobacteria bacterium]